MRSTIVASAAAEHGDAALPLHPRGVVLLTSATLPPPAPMGMGVESVASAAGSGAPTAACEASWTRRYWPGAIDPESGVIWFAAFPKVPVPVALVYWMDHPARSTDAAPRLNSST